MYSRIKEALKGIMVRQTLRRMTFLREKDFYYRYTMNVIIFPSIAGADCVCFLNEVCMPTLVTCACLLGRWFIFFFACLLPLLQASKPPFFRPAIDSYVCGINTQGMSWRRQRTALPCQKMDGKGWAWSDWFSSTYASSTTQSWSTWKMRCAR